VYGFTKDNVHRAKEQVEAFRAACVHFVEGAVRHDIALLAVGDTSSPLFPDALRPFAGARQGDGPMRVNLLVNYGWDWDLNTALHAANGGGAAASSIRPLLASADVSRIQLVVRWGGRRRLSGFLPVQSVYADFYVVDDLWPDYKPEHFYAALRWYQSQDVTLGG
jgi:undecaprenyl diphosphate synthase